MSINLCLKAVRQIFTKSGKEFQQTENFNLWQTPSDVTWAILANETFEDKLIAYGWWCSSRQEEIYKTFHPLIKGADDKFPEVGEEFYFFDPEDSDYEPMIVTEIVLKEDAKFSEMIKGDWTGLGPESISAFIEIRAMSHLESLKWNIKKYRKEEWEFEFYAL